MKSLFSFIPTILFAFILLSPIHEVSAQNVRISNGSFEDTPRKGILDFSSLFRSQPIRGWFDCGAVLFPNASPPDIHQGSTNFWDNELKTAHGKTYLTLVVREDDSYETISQKLMGTLKEGKCYSFSIAMAKSKTYLSHTKDNQIAKQNFIQPAVMRVWGGNSECDLQELLAESEPVDNTDWKDYNFRIEPSSDYTHITLEAYFKTPTWIGYNGNVCIDNARDFVWIDCDQEEVAAIVDVEKEVKTKVMPKRPQKDEVAQEVYVKPNKESKVDTIVYVRPEKENLLTELDIDKVKVGQTIEISNLYFEVDSSSINVESFEVLNELYHFLDDNQDVKILVEGHTNGVFGISDAFCDELSTKRAKAVANYLIAKGIPEERLTYKGYGKRKPIANNRTAAGRKKNQRVQIKIISLS